MYIYKTAVSPFSLLIFLMHSAQESDSELASERQTGLLAPASFALGRLS